MPATESISLRDFLAAHAINGLIAQTNSEEIRLMLDQHDKLPSRFVAVLAYRIADAMLQARNENKTSDTI